MKHTVEQIQLAKKMLHEGVTSLDKIHRESGVSIASIRAMASYYKIKLDSSRASFSKRIDAIVERAQLRGEPQLPQPVTTRQLTEEERERYLVTPRVPVIYLETEAIELSSVEAQLKSILSKLRAFGVVTIKLHLEAYTMKGGKRHE